MEIKVSVIVPMYNTEKYIGKCLESILSQTFTDYEVVIIDDCSTDKSFDIAKKYLIKPNGDKIKLVRRETNSGGPSAPRNDGIKFARGEYILFVDSDDALTSTALEELYSAAKKLDADMLCCRRFYIGNSKMVRTGKVRIKGPDTNAIIQIDSPFVRFIAGKFYPMTWTYFFRREIIIKNNLKFPETVAVGEDKFFVFTALFFAKKCFLVPILYYYYRKTRTSVTTSRKLPSDEYRRNIRYAVQLLQEFEEFAEDKEIFQQNSDLKMKISYRFFHDVAIKRIGMGKLNEKVSFYERNEIIREELSEIKDNIALATFFLNKLFDFQKHILDAREAIKSLREENEMLKEKNNILTENIKKISAQVPDFFTEIKNSES